MAYHGLPQGTPGFLAGLAAQNDKAWFQDHRAEYERDWLAAGLDLAAALSGPCAALGLLAVPRLNASLRRIHRDVRFSSDKRPYDPRLHLILSTSPAFNRAPGVHLVISPGGIGYGVGVYGLEPAGLDAYRRAVCDTGERARFQALLAQAGAVGAVLDPPDLARVPRGFVAAEWDGLLRRKSVIVRTVGDVTFPEWVFSADAVAGWMGLVEAMAPLALWLRPFTLV